MEIKTLVVRHTLHRSKMSKYCAILIMLIVATQFCKALAVCEEGCVRLVNGSLSNEGRVEICSNSTWGTICNDEDWGYNEARVICRQLGYRTVGAQPTRPYCGAGSGPVVLDNVMCNSSEATLLKCQHVNLIDPQQPAMYGCNTDGVAGVKCLIPLETVSVEFISTSHSPLHYVNVSWQLRSEVIFQPSLFNLMCSNDELSHRIEVWVDNKTFMVQLGHLIPSPTNYTCCVRAASGTQLRNVLIDEICTQITVTVASSNPTEPLDKINRISIVGGILGFIIAILLILLAFCGGALLFLLRSRASILKRSLRSVDSNPVEMPVNRSISYVTGTSNSTGDPGSQVNQVTDPGTSDQRGTEPGTAAAEYSQIGPSRRQQPVAQRNQASSAGRYEYSESYQAMASASGDGGGGGTQGEAALPMEYEVPLQGGEHEDYSHLQH